MILYILLVEIVIDVNETQSEKHSLPISLTDDGIVISDKDVQ